MGVKYSNNATTTLPAPITDSATSITVTSTATFPTVTGGDYAYVTLASSTATEVVRCTDITGNVLTVTRAQEGTAASAFTTDDRVEVRVTTAMLTDALAETVANAASSAAAAATSETNAATSYDDFDDRWLGNKASDPTLDNDSAALIDGAAYFNTTNNVLMVYDLGNTSWLRTTPTTSDQTNINLVQANQTNIDTCATDMAKIIKTADDLNEAISEIETVANDLNEASSEIDTVANSIANVDIVGTNIANVNIVGPISANVTTVAAISTDVTAVADSTAAGHIATVSTNITDVDSFANRYRISSSEPVSDNDAGDLHFNTTTNELRSFGTVWQATAPSAANQLNINVVAGDIVHNEDLGLITEALDSTGDAGDIAVVADNITEIQNLVTDIAHVTTVGGSITNVNTVAGSIANVNTVAADGTDIGVVAGKETEIGRLGTADAVADMVILGTTDVVNDMNVLGTSGNVTNMNTLSGISGDITTVSGINADVTAVAADATDIGAVAAKATEIGRLGTADAVADLAILGTADIVTDMNVLGTAANVTAMDTLGTAGNVTNMATVAADIADINTVAGISSGVNFFTDRYRVGATDPVSSNDAGDLFFNTTSNELRSYGTAWQATAPDAVNQNNINIVAGELLYHEDLGLITEAVLTASATGDVATVAASIDAVDRLGTVDAVADMAILATPDIVADMAILGTTDVVADLNTLGTADVVNDLNVLGTADVVTDMNVLGTAANVTAMANCSANVTDINRYSDEYVISSSQPGSPSEGDLWYDETAHILKFYNGSIFAAIAAGIADVQSDAAPTLGGNLDADDNNITNLGTLSGTNLQIDFGGLT